MGSYVFLCGSRSDFCGSRSIMLPYLEVYGSVRAKTTRPGTIYKTHKAQDLAPFIRLRGLVFHIFHRAVENSA